MRKSLVLVMVVAFVGALSALAYAQVTQTNTYNVTASTSPKKQGSTKKPVPLKINFNFTVGEANNNRPAVVKKYSIFFGGTRVNNNFFPACTQAKLQGANGKAACSKAVVGGGYVENIVGPSNDKTSKPLTCNLKLTVYNVRNKRALLLVEGGQNATDPRMKCIADFGPSNGVIPANYVRKSSGTSLEFEVPSNLLHPASTVDVSIVRTRSTIKRRTVRKNGKKRGYYESIGGCKGKRRTVRVKFTEESGDTRNASTTVKCKK
jgi:hypothetical protein